MVCKHSVGFDLLVPTWDRPGSVCCRGTLMLGHEHSALRVTDTARGFSSRTLDEAVCRTVALSSTAPAGAVRGALKLST